MKLTFSFRAALAAGAALLVSTSALADDAASAGETPERPSREEIIAAAIEVDTEAAKAVLKRSADFLAAQEKFSFKAHMSHDAVQANGQKLQFGGMREATVRRPDRLWLHTVTRLDEERTLYFDGEKISIDLPEENAYISVEKPGTVDEAIEYLVDDLETPAPLHEFMTDNYFAEISDKIRSAYFVATDTLGKKTCDHLAFRTDEVDVQIWIETGDEPLPCAMVITYKRAEASPQFRAIFEEWDLSPKASDRVFTYKPPKGAEQISLEVAMSDAKETE